MHILVLTPTIDGKLTTAYTSSLVNTIFACLQKGINVSVMTFDHDPILQHSRNVLLDRALNSDIDSAIWIDSDIEWKPEDFIKLATSVHEVIGGTYRKKNDIEEYVVGNTYTGISNLTEVSHLGFGFIKMSYNAMKKLSESSDKYNDMDGLLSNAFEIKIINGEMHSEDVVVCHKLKQLGFKVYLDKSITCNHIGTKKYIGDFNEWHKTIQS